MRDAEHAVTFHPLGKTVHVLAGTRLVEAAAEAGLVLDSPCGGEGICGKCRVVVRRGDCPPSPADQRVFSPQELEAGWRLGCQASLTGPTEIEVPEASLLTATHKILAQTVTPLPDVLDPPVRKRFIELARPARSDDASDQQRLQGYLGPCSIDLDMLRLLPGQLRASGFSGTAVVVDGRLIDFEPGNTETVALAVAVDVGTTTVVAALLDLVGGEPIQVVSRLNPQTRFGDDVLSRILHAKQQTDGLETLHQTITASINEMIGELAAAAGVARERIYEITLSGNTTMQQLLARIDPRSLGEVPFVSVANHSIAADAAQLGLRIHPRGRALLLPVIGGFVGGDTVAGMLATNMANAGGPTLLIDIGTNGEIVLAAGGRLMAASTAAGPAFEGARIMHGMRGAVGAVEKVVVDGKLRINVIGNVPPVGICGSALIDLGAEMLRHGLLSPEGRLQRPDDLSGGAAADLARRLIDYDGKPAFLVAEEGETGTGRSIVLTQRDIRELQLASGAIRAGITILLRRAGLQPGDLESVLVAGGFGNFIRRSNAQRIGLLPHGIGRHRIRYQGNTSLAGAQLVALSTTARQLADELAARTEHVDLSHDPAFRDIFAESMIFPADEEPAV